MKQSDIHARWQQLNSIRYAQIRAATEAIDRSQADERAELMRLCGEQGHIYNFEPLSLSTRCVCCSKRAEPVLPAVMESQ